MDRSLRGAGTQRSEYLNVGGEEQKRAPVCAINYCVAVVLLYYCGVERSLQQGLSVLADLP